LNVLSLFSGIGGIDLGLERAGMKIVAHSEIDPYACRVLRQHWPNVHNIGDITKVEWTNPLRAVLPVSEYIGQVDLVAGGFPCQDVSAAGQRAGLKEGTRSGLWSEFARCIREIRPRYVLVENVVGLRSKGMEQVLSDLAACGFNAWWDTLPAAAFGAPQLRERVCIIGTRADAPPFDMSVGPIEWAATTNTAQQSEREPTDEAITVAVGGTPWDELGLGRELASDADRAGRQGRRPEHELRGHQEEAPPSRDSWWSTEPDVGRVAHGVPARMDRLRCLGNAVVPQWAQYVGEQIMAHASMAEAA
jgi:DNA (cytosine-5)-methyltransferase 1